MSRATIWPSTGTTRPQPTEGDAEVDVVVVGAGIAGMATALLLGEAGRTVSLISRHPAGRTVTGRSNAKVTALHQLVYADLAKRHGESAASDYARANTAALSWLRERAGELMGEAAAVTVARDQEERDLLEEEHRAAARAGLDVTLQEAPAAFPGAVAGLRLGGQGQVDPVALLDRLEAQLPANVVHTHGVATGLRETPVGATVTGDGWSRSATHVVVATGLPIFDRGAYFALCEPQTSYMLAFEHTGALAPRDMLITAGEPKRSVRWARVDGREVLLVGGAGHRTGAVPPPDGLVELEAWARDTYTGVGRRLALWSAQDFMSPDRLPFAGQLHRVWGPTHVITGLSKWGFTLGVAAAQAMARRLTNQAPTAFDRLIDPARVPGPRGLGTIASSNAEVGVRMAGGWAGALLRGGPADLAEGEGTVARDLPTPCATSVVDGDRRTVSAVCPHLGGIVAWNQMENSWDCPLHGSRFEPDGEVLHGPAVRDLSKKAPES